MIKFFRKIRQNLLSEGKTGKYLKYAIGEIVLVVIGILIALQINNWNEERKQRIETDLYKTRLINDLKADLSSIQEALKIRTESINKTKAYFAFFESNEVSLKTMIDSSMTVQFQLHRYIPINYTFEDMQNSGKLNLLNQEQQKLLLELSNKQKTAQLMAEKHMEEFFSEARQAHKYLGRQANINDEMFYEKIGIEKSDEYYAQGLLHRHNMLHALNIYHIVQINIGKEMMMKSQAVINVLREQ